MSQKITYQTKTCTQLSFSLKTLKSPCSQQHHILPLVFFPMFPPLSIPYISLFCRPITIATFQLFRKNMFLLLLYRLDKPLIRVYVIFVQCIINEYIILVMYNIVTYYLSYSYYIISTFLVVYDVCYMYILRTHKPHLKEGESPTKQNPKFQQKPSTNLKSSCIIIIIIIIICQYNLTITSSCIRAKGRLFLFPFPTFNYMPPKAQFPFIFMWVFLLIPFPIILTHSSITIIFSSMFQYYFNSNIFLLLIPSFFPLSFSIYIYTYVYMTFSSTQFRGITKLSHVSLKLRNNQ